MQTRRGTMVLLLPEAGERGPRRATDPYHGFGVLEGHRLSHPRVLLHEPRHGCEEDHGLLPGKGSQWNQDPLEDERVSSTRGKCHLHHSLERSTEGNHYLDNGVVLRACSLSTSTFFFFFFFCSLAASSPCAVYTPSQPPADHSIDVLLNPSQRLIQTHRNRFQQRGLYLTIALPPTAMAPSAPCDDEERTMRGWTTTTPSCCRTGSDGTQLRAVQELLAR